MDFSSADQSVRSERVEDAARIKWSGLSGTMTVGIEGPLMAAVDGSFENSQLFLFDLMADGSCTDGCSQEVGFDLNRHKDLSNEYQASLELSML